tara:strand:- start:1918 stop:2358 length:441 start_codon:yes stop_codon:yes gene_type:complete
MFRSALVGAPLSGRRGVDASHARLDAHLRGVVDLIPHTYGTGPAVRQAVAEFAKIPELPNTATGLACKRAALLFALHSEPELKAYFADEPYARELSERVLPFVVPRFLKHSCQSPEAFVQACVVLADMWEGEPLGNWGKAGSESAR